MFGSWNSLPRHVYLHGKLYDFMADLTRIGDRSW